MSAICIVATGPLCASAPVIPKAEVAPRELPAALFSVPIDVIEAVLEQDNLVDQLPLRHYFSDGCYAREILMPAGTLATSRRHLTNHLCILSAGRITVWGDGVEPELYEAPHTFVGTPGTRRIGYVHEDTIWTTIFPNPDGERDIDVLLDRFTEKVPSQLSEGTVVPSLPELLAEAEALR